MLVFQFWRASLNQIEQPLSSRRYVGAVLNVFRRPKTFGSRVVTFIEQRVKRLQNQLLVFFGSCFHHKSPSKIWLIFVFNPVKRVVRDAETPLRAENEPHGLSPS